ncbi:DsbA family protein [Fodinicola feengrottensis]|uniref:Thioredoxin-like fold domain-containing protein n=1 Tax=Fodinicola feengrottensis TaxID=435914 RepID=A0ABN2FXB8_9ACTN|nr:thioredoxin domain-containing protein [Fodinicola feengrottensis]
MSKNSGRPNRARQVAAQRLAAQRRRQRIVTTSIVGVVVIAVLAIAAIVGVTVYNSTHKPTLPLAAPKGGTVTGVYVGKSTAKVTVDLYIDFMCPICHQFETTTGPTIQKMVDAGTVRIYYHPLAYLDRFSSGTNYSSRASAASACAADAGLFDQYRGVLYDNQPEENSTGLTNTQLIQFGQQAGAPAAAFEKCVNDGKYAAWTAHLTDSASKGKITGTPTVKVNGTVVNGGTADSVPTTQQVTDAINAALKK